MYIIAGSTALHIVQEEVLIPTPPFWHLLTPHILAQEISKVQPKECMQGL